MSDEELARLLQMSQDPKITDGQRKVLASHFGLVAALLVIARSNAAAREKRDAALRVVVDSADRGAHSEGFNLAMGAVKEVMGWN